MAKQFSIEKAASDTSINKKPGILVKIFRRLLLSQFKEIKHGCIVIENKLSYDTNLRLIFDRSKYDVRYRSASLFSDLGDRIIADDVKLTVKAKFKKVSKI